MLGGLRSAITANTTDEIVPGKDLIPVTGACLDPDDILSSINVLVGGWLTDGLACKRFETSLCQYLGVHDTYLVNSGSSANLLAFAAICSPSLGRRAVQPGDEVITVAAGFPTTVNPIVQYGCVPVFVDVDLRTANIDVDQIAQAISSRTKAIILAHTLGNPFDVHPVRRLAREHNLWLIEDNCDALGATYHGAKTGTFGDLSTLSFYPAHHITTGEGGAVLVNNPELSVIVERLRSWGRDCWCKPGQDNACGMRFSQEHGDLPCGYDHKYVYSEIGYNLKMTDMQAAIGANQLDKIETFVAQRRQNHALLQELLSPFAGHFLLPTRQPNANPSWFGYLIVIQDARIDRRDLIHFLTERKIGTRLLFGGNLTKQPAYQKVQCRIAGSLANADRIMEDAFWLGVWPGLEEAHMRYMAETLGEFVQASTKITL